MAEGELSRLYAVCGDDDLTTLDTLALTAGLIWVCTSCGANGGEYDADCPNCGARKPEEK
jgi:rubrerythrin